MTAHGGESPMNRRQKALIDRLCRAPYCTVAAAARELGVPVDTANRWSATPEFRTALETQRKEEAESLRGELLAQLLAQGDAAVACKIALLDAESENVRHLASSWLLDRILGKVGAPDEEAVTREVPGFLWEALVRQLDGAEREEQQDAASHPASGLLSVPTVHSSPPPPPMLPDASPVGESGPLSGSRWNASSIAASSSSK